MLALHLLFLLLLVGKVPPWTDRLHLTPYWLGDSRYAIRIAARKAVGRDGGRFIDLNFQRTLDGVVNCHWGTARRNGFYFIVVRPGKRRPLTEEELDRPIAEWATADVIRWRRTKRAGLSLASRIRIYTFAEQVRYAARRGVRICAELKSKTFDDLRVAAQMVAVSVRNNAGVIFMTLVTMPNWGPKLRAFHEAGGQTALLAHGAARPTNLEHFRPYIDQIWGDFR